MFSGFCCVLVFFSVSRTQSLPENSNQYAPGIEDTYDGTLSLSSIPITQIQKKSDFQPKDPKNFTLALYMAADNDLARYAIRNIRQMSTIGSTNSVNIVAHLDIKLNNKKVRSHFYVEKDKVLEFNVGDQVFDSGNPESLIKFMSFVVENFPAEHYMLVFWDHGTGIVDPIENKKIRVTDLFFYNPKIHKLELDRSLDYLELICASENNTMDCLMLRGICWDDTTSHYLTNHKLAYALSIIKNDVMGGRKFDIIGFDACLMSMLEVATLIKNYGNIMVSSQEVELGAGWNYQSILHPFMHGTMDPVTFSQHIVKSYEKTYNPHTNDYTLSAINLNHIEDLEHNLNTVAKILLSCLEIQKNNSVKQAIAVSRNRRLCTHFDTPQYIDLHHFYRNLQSNISLFACTNEQEGNRLKQLLHTKLEEGKSIIEKMVIENVVGRNLSQAKGISVYFPEQRIHPSYPKTLFAANNTWGTLLREIVPLTH
jgi:hypothetical protein